MEALATQTPAERVRTLAASPEAVVVDRIGKGFRLPHQQYSTLKERALHPFARGTDEQLTALHEVSFDVKEGEFFGIVGRNGSGKSTLLKCLAGIYGVDRGTISIDGRVSPFIELGVGFNPDLTARDNVLINAIMLGLTRREARRRFDEIIDFAELRDFIDLKLKNYSSGMSVRLGFSVAIQVDAAVILVDEVLAVGDAAFQRKCFEQFERMRSEGRTILFVTHDMNSIERFCDRAMLLEKGHVVEIGDPDEIGRRYNEANFGQLSNDGKAMEDVTSPGARIRKAWCENADGERILACDQGDTIVACMEVEFLKALDNPAFNLTFRNEIRHTIFVAHSASRLAAGSFEPGERATIRFAFENWLAPSHYTLTPAVGVWTPEYTMLDQRPDVTTLIVESGVNSGGVLDIPTEIEMNRS